MQNSAGAPQGERYRWHISLRAPAGGQPLMGAEKMTAPELMFFFGAPLAQVVEYEEHLRTKRIEGPQPNAARLTRMAVSRHFLALAEEPLAAEAG